MNLDTPGLAEFLDRQLRDFGGQLEIAPGLWAVLGVAANDADALQLAQALLAEANFAYEHGEAEGDHWTLYYVNAANRPAALHWLDDTNRRVRGDVLLPTPEQRRLITEVGESTMPHRVAQKLAEEHAAGRLSAGTLRAPAAVRALLDRLHLREPLFYAAFAQLLEQHLIDMRVLLQQIIAEDVGLLNELVKGSLSRDPFMQSRQDTAGAIRRNLIEFCVINSLDQQKATGLANPYAAYLDVRHRGADVLLTLEGVTSTTPAARFVDTVHALRRQLYRGEKFEEFDTHAPWMRDDIAHPFRFIKKQLAAHPDLTPLDGLFMLEHAVE